MNPMISEDGRKFITYEKDPKYFRRAFALRSVSLPEKESPHLMRETHTLISPVMAVNTAFANWKDLLKEDPLYLLPNKENLRLHLTGLGDVGGTMLTGLRLKAGKKIASIGIYDKDQNRLERYEKEMNQIFCYEEEMPEIEILEEERLFDCDVFVFAVAVAVPSIEEGKNIDVRMVQYEKNRAVVSYYAKLARKKGFKGLFAVVSDPVDQLCRSAYLASNENEQGLWDGKGLGNDQIRGFGLGVMNARARYYAKKLFPDLPYDEFGRAFGPHGKGLVIANSISRYDETISDQLTNLAETANLRIREIGYKPYIAPALSSGCMSLLRCLGGEWHYSSTFIGGIWFGCRNRLTSLGNEIETYNFPEPLFKKIENSYNELFSHAEGVKKI